MEENISCQINATLRVTMVLVPPFAMLTNDTKSSQQADGLAGYAVDILKELAALCGFNYTIAFTQDGTFGAPLANGTWSGMVGDLVRNEADLSLMIGFDFERAKAVDFTLPYMQSGISVLLKRQERASPSLLTFFGPFSLGVWLFIMLAILMFTVSLWLMVKWTPYEQNNIMRISTGPMSLLNSWWYIISGLLAQGTSFDMLAPSTRLLTAVWWTFTYVIMAAYTANLAAFLTIQRFEYPISSIQDLVRQSKIEYGTVVGSAELLFFKYAKLEPYQSMYYHMTGSNSKAMVDDELKGIERVKSGTYAFLYNRKALEFYSLSSCELVLLDGEIGVRAAGMAVRKGFPYRDMLSNAILYLTDTTKLSVLNDKWYRNQVSGCSHHSETESNALDIHHLAGLFLALAAGFVIANLMAVAEKIFKQNGKGNQTEKVTTKTSKSIVRSASAL